jgi:hypothetical protein
MKVVLSIITLAVGLTAQAQDNVLKLNGPVDGPVCRKVGDNLVLTPCVLTDFTQVVLGSAMTTVDSNPRGADIVYDGVVLSRTPAMLILHNRNYGETTAITLRKDGYRDASVKVHDGSDSPIPLELDSSTKNPKSRPKQETSSGFPQKLEQAYAEHQAQTPKMKPSASESQADEALDAALGDCEDSMIGTGRFLSVDLAGNLDLKRSSLRVMVACQSQVGAWITSCEKETGLAEGNSSCTAMSLRITASLVHDAWNHRDNLKAWANRP